MSFTPTIKRDTTQLSGIGQLEGQKQLPKSPTLGKPDHKPYYSSRATKVHFDKNIKNKITFKKAHSKITTQRDPLKNVNIFIQNYTNINIDPSIFYD